MNQTEKIIAYCLGALPDEDRVSVEESLLDSKDFLIEMITVKRALESEAVFKVQPSPQLKSRIRREIARPFIPKILFLRPAMSMAAVVLVVIGTAAIFLHKPNPPVSSEIKNGVAVDAANALPVNFNVL